MGLQRLAISNPSANIDTNLYTANNQYLMSVIAANKSSSNSASIRVWVEPSGSSTPAEYAYIVYDLTVDASNSFETFRFAVNQNDVVRIRSTTADLSFQAYGLVQYDINLGVGISSYSATAPTNTVDGLIWVDSDATGTGQNKPAYVWDSQSSSWVQLIGGTDESADYNFTGNISIGNVSSTEISYLDGATSNLQNQINLKQDLIPFSSTSPTGPSIGDYWVDSSISSSPILKVYDGSQWVSSGSLPNSENSITAMELFS